MLKKNIYKTMSYYKGLSKPAKASIWFLLCNIIQKCFSIISTPIFTRIMTTEQYGQVSNYYAWYDLIYPFATLYITGVAFNNILIKNNNKNQSTFSISVLTSSITIVVFIIYFIAQNTFNKFFGISTLMMCVMFCEMLFIPIFDLWSTRERYEYKYKKIVLLTMASTISNLILGMVFVVFSTYKYEARIISKVVITVLIGITIYISLYKKANRKISMEHWWYALKMSLPLIPHYLSIKMLNQSDRVMITNMVGLSYTGIYSLAYTISTLMAVVTEAINRTLCPFIYNKIKEKDFPSIRKVSNYAILTVLVVTIIEMLVAPEILMVFGTSDYFEAIWIIPPVALSVYFTFVYVIFSNVEFYFEKTIPATISSIFVTLMNIVLNLIFIHKFGYMAAGYTTLVSYILFAFIHFRIYQKIIQTNDELRGIFDVRFIFIISLVGIVLMFICLLLYNNQVIRYICLAISITVGLFLVKKRGIYGNIKNKK